MGEFNLGLPAAAVLAAVAEGGACVLDVDTPTARSILEYNWEKLIAKVPTERPLELRLVSIWVSLGSLDAVERQLAPLRSQATSDIEWALTSNSFDFTVLNE